MKSVARAILALLAAAMAPAAIVLLPYMIGFLASASGTNPWTGFGNVATLVLGASFLYVVVLGLPAFLILQWRKAIRWWTSVAIGFLLGCLPVAVSLWPIDDEGTSISRWDGEKMAQSVVDGAPTLAGWLSYAKVVAFMGIFGAIGGLAFWLVWHGMQSNKTMEPTR